MTCPLLSRIAQPWGRRMGAMRLGLTIGPAMVAGTDHFRVTLPTGAQTTGYLHRASCDLMVGASNHSSRRNSRMTAPTGYLTLDQLRNAISEGDVDTVIVAFTDMQGRLVGKRVSARLFLDDVAGHGAEACNYLLAVDVEMNTVDGYAMSSWERGYGDFEMKPDFETLRRIP